MRCEVQRGMEGWDKETFYASIVVDMLVVLCLRTCR